jgi:hypothetical protein
MRRVPQRSSCVLNARWRQPRSWFGTKRPQVQILSPRPVPQVSELRECRILREVSHSHAHATDAWRPTRRNTREPQGRPAGQLRQEPVFGQINVAQGGHQLRLRGKVKADFEWTFHLTCHNFRKLAGSG